MTELANPMPVQSLSYAPPAGKTSTRVWAAAVIGVLALGLIGLGGCFLIGVMFAVVPSSMGFKPGAVPPPWTAKMYLFVGALYLMALVCFTTAGWLLFVSVRGLLRIVQAVA